MVAQLSNEICLDAWLSPSPEPTDSDDVVVALQAARALEMDGDAPGAVRWMRQAIDAAEQDGDDTRVLALASAAADLASTLRTTPPPVPPPRKRPTPSSSAPPNRVPSPKTAANDTALAHDKRGAGPVAIRVGLRLSDEDTDILVIRRLRPGQPVPPGLEPVLLVLDACVGDPFTPSSSGPPSSKLPR